MLAEVGRVDCNDPDFLDEVLKEARRRRLLSYLTGRLSPGLRPRVDPEEVLQEVYLRAWQRWDAFKGAHAPDQRPYDLWLFVLARDYLFDLHRHHHARKCDVRQNVPFPDTSASQLLLGIYNPGTNPEMKAERAEQEARLKEVIARLKPKDQELLRLRYQEKLKWEGVGAKLGLTAGNARQKHNRVIRRLGDLLADLKSDEGLLP